MKKFKNLICKILIISIVLSNTFITRSFANSYKSDSIKIKGKTYGYNIKPSTSNGKSITLIAGGETYTFNVSKDHPNYDELVWEANCFAGTLDDIKITRENDMLNETKELDIPDIISISDLVKTILSELDKGTSISKIISIIKDKFKVPTNPLELLKTIVEKAFSFSLSAATIANYDELNTRFKKFKELATTVAVKSIKLNETSLTLNLESSYKLIATINPTNATNKNITWKSTNKNIATVDNYGNVKAVGTGTTSIVAKISDSIRAVCRVTVTKPVSVTSVELDRTSMTLHIGRAHKLTETVYPTNATNKNITWRSSNRSVATVDTNGRVTAVGTGVTTITAKSNNGKTATCRVTVTNPTVAVTSVKLDRTSMTLHTGRAHKLTETVYPTNATNKSVTWTSSNRNVATVDTNGRVTAVGTGVTTITAKSNNGKTATCRVTVTNPTVAVTSIKLNKTSMTLNRGRSYKLTATINPTNATNKNVTWASSNKNIATVDAYGNVKAVGTGTATITVTTKDGNKKSTCRVTVPKPTVSVTSVKLNKTSMTLNRGRSYKLTATINPTNATNKNVTWASSNKNIATVDAYGNVKAVGTGTATITVTTKDGNKKSTCRVTVPKPTVSVTSVKLNKTSMTLNRGRSYKLTATINPTNATNKNVTWASSNKNIATVDAYGNVKALRKGTVTITVTTKDGNKKSTCKVTVK